MGRIEFSLRSDWLAQWKGHVTKIEPAAVGSTNGVPDIFLACAGLSGWVEFKKLEDDGTFELNAKQKIWHRDYSKWQPNSLVCVLSRGGWWLVPSSIAIGNNNVMGPPVSWVETDHFMICRLLEFCFHWRGGNEKASQQFSKKLQDCAHPH